jgi:Protein of unknown function (DUF5661)
MSEPLTRFGEADAARLAEALGLDLVAEPFDLEEFRIGLNVELEHGSRTAETDVTHDDPLATAKIALAHLREIPDYYTRLVAMERQAEGYPTI